MTRAARGAGVAELTALLLERDADAFGSTLEHDGVEIGRALDDRAILLHPHGRGALIAGLSGGGKSTLATAFLERFAARAFQVCVLDPGGLRSLGARDRRGRREGAAASSGGAQGAGAPGSQRRRYARRIGRGSAADLRKLPFGRGGSADAHWMATAIKDDELAADVRRAEEDPDPAASRQRVREAIERRYTAPTDASERRVGG